MIVMAIKMNEITGMDEIALEKKLHEFEIELIAGEVKKAKTIKLSIARIKSRLCELKKTKSLKTEEK